MNDKKFVSWEDAVRWLLGQPKHQELVVACYFDRPALGAARRFHKSEEWRAVQELMPSHIGTVLDVGAGMGIASYALAMDGWETTALEPDTSGLVGSGAIRKLAYEADIKISVVEKWGEKLPFANASFDVIHARQVLHHAHDLEQFCAELYRVLKPGGRIIATREHVISNPKQLSVFLAKHPLNDLYGGENAFQRVEYINSLKKAGFTMEKVLGPWDSIINSTPFTRHKLHELFNIRFGHYRVANWLARLAFSRVGFRLVLVALSILDRRPGRLYTFVAVKHEEKS